MTTTRTDAPFTRAALRSLLWDGADGERPALPEPVGPASPPPVAVAVHPSQKALESLDDLTIAKIRLLEMRTPPRTQLAALARNPIPWILISLATGALLSRSKVAHAAAGWIVTRAIGRTTKTTRRRLAAKPTGLRALFRMNPLS